MPPQLTVKAVRSAERTRLEQAVLALQQQAVTIAAALTTAEEDANKAAKAVADLQAGESTLRQQLAVAVMPATIDQLEQDLEANLRLQRPALAALAEAQDQVAMRTRERRRADATLDRTRAQLAQADADLILAQRDDDQANLWRAALGGQTLASVVTTAGDSQVISQVNGAKARLTALLGDAQLFDLLEQRYDAATAAAEDRAAAAARAVAAVDAVHVEQAGIAGAVLQAADEFALVRERVRAAAERSEQRLASSRSVLQGVSGAPDLPPEVQARIDARAATATSAVGGAASAASREKELREAEIRLITAAAALEELVLPKQALDPAYDPAGDPDAAVAKAIADKGAADALRREKHDAFEQQHADKIDGWEVAVPPLVMALATDALRAMAAIDAVRSLDPAQLTQDLDAAEEAYAEALAAQDKARTLLEAAAARAAARLDDAAAVQPVSDLRIAALVRGDQ